MFKANGLFENETISNTIFDIVNGKKIIEICGPSMNNYWIPRFYNISESTDFINFSAKNNIDLNNKLQENCKFIQTNDIEDFGKINNYPIFLPKYSCSVLVPSITVRGYNFMSFTIV